MMKSSQISLPWSSEPKIYSLQQTVRAKCPFVEVTDELKGRSSSDFLCAGFKLRSPSQGGGGTYSHDPSIFFLFYPLFPIIITNCSLKCFKLPWSQELKRRTLDPEKYLSLFPVLVCLFYLLFIVEEILIEIRLVFPSSQQSNQEFPCSLKRI